MTPQTINRKIKKLPDNLKGKISDGYHTFAELYDHRCVLFAGLLNLAVAATDMDCWKSKTNNDGSVWEGWFVAGISDKITYHLPMRLWDIVHVPEIEKGKFDGHSSMIALSRLAILVDSINKKEEE